MWNCRECNRVMKDYEQRCNGCGLSKPTDYELELEGIVIENQKVKTDVNETNSADKNISEEEKDDKIFVIVDRRIAESKKKILDYYHISADINEVTEEQYEKLIKYKFTDENSQIIPQDKLTTGAYTWGDIVFVLAILIGVVSAFAAFSVSFLAGITALIIYIIVGIVTRLFIRIVGRIVELLNEINERIKLM